MVEIFIIGLILCAIILYAAYNLSCWMEYRVIYIRFKNREFPTTITGWENYLTQPHTDHFVHFYVHINNELIKELSISKSGRIKLSGDEWIGYGIQKYLIFSNYYYSKKFLKLTNKMCSEFLTTAPIFQTVRPDDFEHIAMYQTGFTMSYSGATWCVEDEKKPFKFLQ